MSIVYYVFDLDGTLLDTKDVTKEAYNRVAPGLYKDEYFGLSGAEWGCSKEVHAAKAVEYNKIVSEQDVPKAWAWEVYINAIHSGYPVVILTGASRDTVRALTPHLGASPGRVICGLSMSEKIEALKGFRNGVVRYYDDNPVTTKENIPGVVTYANLSHHDTVAVVLAGGSGDRFKPYNKLMCTYKDRTLVQNTVISSMEALRSVIVGPSSLPSYGCASVILDKVLPGPAASGMAAFQHIRLDEPVLFMDADSWYPPGVILETLDLAYNSSADVVVSGSMPPKDNHERYGVIDLRGNRVLEGGYATGDNMVCTGLYWFRTGAEFVRRYGAVITEGAEIKMSELVSADRAPVGVVHLSHGEQWVPLGSPEAITKNNGKLTKG